MIRVVVLALSIAFTGGLLGCGQSPEKACKKIMKMYNADRKARNKEAMPKDREKKRLERCVEKLKERKKESPKRYKCEMTCIKKSPSFEEYASCNKDCK